jgi:hypothetical protein
MSVTSPLGEIFGSLKLQQTLVPGTAWPIPVPATVTGRKKGTPICQMTTTQKLHIFSRR